jgi:cell division protein FtsI (penicillin-binding protein 3)
MAFGHGLAVTPLQFASAAAGLLNGGKRITPTFLRRDSAERKTEAAPRLVSENTSRMLRDLMRRNVTDPGGTGRRADVPGYNVGGKTGTAEMAVAGGYRKKSVIASFLGAFPAEAPRYLTLVMLFEPEGQKVTGGEITAGRNAAPTTARIIERIAPLLGVATAGL